MLLEPGLNVSEYLIWDFPGKKMGSLGITSPLTVGELLSGFLAAAGGNMAIVLSRQD